MTVEGTYIRFISLGLEPGRKTERWRVDTKEDEDSLGFVEWFGRWRKYAFFPLTGCVLGETCMREISDFLEEARKRKFP